MCHGDSAVNRGGVPDLRYSQAITDERVFRAFVLEGAAQPLGMPDFSDEYSEDQVEAIRSYVVKRANDRLAE